MLSNVNEQRLGILVQNLCLGEKERSREKEEAVNDTGKELLKYTYSNWVS